MQLKRALNAFTKAGCTFKHDEGSTKYYVTLKDTTLEFYENGRGSGEVLSFTCRSPNTDIMRDYFDDTHFHTIKSAIKFIVHGTF